MRSKGQTFYEKNADCQVQISTIVMSFEYKYQENTRNHCAYQILNYLDAVKMENGLNIKYPHVCLYKGLLSSKFRRKKECLVKFRLSSFITGYF